ncbi:MAG: sugar phosphate isomerase/epimerase [Rhizobiaceae bacterium]|nr:sugar phosphate isomerase/epimerase [Rhizobiaceae bacterium]
MPILSLANLMMPEVDPLQQIDVAAEAGFDAVGLCINPPDRLGASLVRDPALRRRVKDHLADRRITVLDIEVFPLTPEIDPAAFVPALETGAELGATFVLVTGNDTDEARVCDKYARLCDLAAPLGLRPTLEFISYRPLRDILQADRWLKRAGRAQGGMCVDALHLFRSGGTLEELRQIAPSDIGYAQLCDAASMQPAQFFTEEQLLRESRTDRRLPGEGVLPLVEFLDALPPDLAISVEAPCEAYAHLSPKERAVLAMASSRAILAQAKPR